MKQTLLIELLTEELPPKVLEKLSTTFANEVFAALKEQALLGDDSACTPYCTPRRLAVSITEVEAQQADRIIERKGPAVAAGLDAEGKPTKALEGFMRSANVTLAQLQRAGEGKAECFVARIEQKGKPLEEYISAIIMQALKKLPVPKLMRWGDQEHQFVRPVHGLTVLLGSNVVPAEVLGLTSGNVTSGHRFLCSERVSIEHADDYEATLARDGRVVASYANRRESIAARLEQLAGENKAIWIGHANFDQSKLMSMSNEERSLLSSLLDEVTALVEWPEVYVGQFEEEYLEVPQECLILTMQQNQKYFPLLDAQTGKLLNKFLIVSNMQIADPHHIIEGNQRVVRPRLADARFFFNQDRKQKLETRVEKLGNVVYHNKLGTQLQRVERITTLAGTIARLLGADKADTELAARLSKADLITDMVGEFPELQGIIGHYYALHDGEKPEVASAIEAHYHPRFAGDTLPQGPLACAVALADKLETLVGIYGIGQVPTGDKDPFGLRRQALGILRILIETPLDLTLPALLKATADNFPQGMLSATVATDVEGFMIDRLRGYLRDQSFEGTHIEAVLAVLGGRLHEVLPRLQGVRAFAAMSAAKDLAAANKRVQNIMRKNAEELGELPASIDVTLFQDEAERELYQAMLDITPMARGYFERGDYSNNLKTLVTLKSFVDDFFDKVMVMCEDKALRINRALLLQQLGRLMNQSADISKLAA
ncbi:MAG: glycine--tRNA ligase subunit beta [Gammaproteobacteria bacterium]|nr:glycine--tRNA ligase subunit beta [Sideroxydans sp.]MBU3904221.1 glycine--tRNA ligase subunit beta [Gammaproteobacteria bacterium]MBU4045900.1 glycine--tRNA ligase subunit beta [Gammaproteobacteria bacterium]MBU4150254.1 glycine--tRNA ligase subunit beta [Gammaproteobacteria bacterium]